jgi:hypothetical protein
VVEKSEKEEEVPLHKEEEGKEKKGEREYGEKESIHEANDQKEEGEAEGDTK